MESVFIFIVVIMFALAITDLIVGVSNDAVNFLNSAVGAKAGTFRQIMIIASIGIMFGAICSSGMMEVARKGVFNPQFFNVEEIMFLFAAVMLTDIILLDFYNSVALPTSTTVSIVFELLGSALAISFFSSFQNDHSISYWGNYINGTSAIFIIAGIFLSVAVAFLMGWLIQYITRLIISFDYKKSMRGFGSLFGGISIALIMTFIIQKGLKAVPFLSEESLNAIKEQTGWISLISFAVSIIIFQILLRKESFNIYRFVTLLGTFALAMAFASNDLVNFVGVPIASFDAYSGWKASGVEANEYMMDSFAEPVKSNPLFLIAAGIVMTLTLWFSKKAKSVVQTSVNLGRQEEGNERFKANETSRNLVKAVASMDKWVAGALPQSTRSWINSRFVQSKESNEVAIADRPAFDLVRSSVNLIVAAAIILAATSLKLPLSTTFVSFMVLMGTSLADRAWGQGSAVYRISGVLTVIGGWLMTAVIAMTVSIIFASLLFNFKIYALIALVIMAILLIFKSQIFYRHNRLKAEVTLELADEWFKTNFLDIESEVREKLALILERYDRAYTNAINALLDGDRKALKQIMVLLKDVETTNELYKVKLSQQIKSVPKEYREDGRILMYIYDMENELIVALGKIIRECEKHVSNLHPPLTDDQVKGFRNSQSHLKSFMDEILECFSSYLITQEKYMHFKKVRKQLLKEMDQAVAGQLAEASEKDLSAKNSELVLSILFSSKDIVISCSSLVKLFYKVKTVDVGDFILDEILD